MSTITISLPDELKQFVERRMAERKYASPSEYIRDLISDEQRRVETAKLEVLLVEGLDSGEGIELSERYLTDLDGRIQARIDSVKAGVNREEAR